jgi:hypothetical protein
VLLALQGRITVTIADVDGRDTFAETARDLIHSTRAVTGVRLMGVTVPDRIALTISKPARVRTLTLTIRIIPIRTPTAVRRAGTLERVEIDGVIAKRRDALTEGVTQVAAIDQFTVETCLRTLIFADLSAQALSAHLRLHVAGRT